MACPPANCTVSPGLVLGAVGTSLGIISLIFCIIQAIIMAKLYKRLSQRIQLNARLATDNFSKETANSEDDRDDVREIAAVFSDEYDDVASPGMTMMPVTTHQQIAYPTSPKNCLESYTSDSPTFERGVTSPSVAELKNSLELPLKRLFDKSCTLDNRNMFKYPDHQSQTMKSIRPRAQTSNALMGADRSSEIARTPNESESQATLNTPGSNGSPCKSPMAYVVTEIVDVKDTKKRPSIRLRESRPKKNLSKAIQKQLDEPEPFYFGLEKKAVPEAEVLQDKEACTSSPPVQKRDVSKGWRQVLPIVTDRNKVFASCDENENTCAVSPDKDGPSSRNMTDKDIKFKQKVALKPPARNSRPVLEKSSSVGTQRGGTWSPRTLERHRMLHSEPVERSNLRDHNRVRVGSLRERLPSPYELVEYPSTLSVTSVTCAEDFGCYSNIVRKHDGRRRSLSTGSSDISGRHSDRSYNKLTIGV